MKRTAKPGLGQGLEKMDIPARHTAGDGWH